MRYALYYNYKIIGDVLMVVFDSNSYPDTVKTVNNVTALYKEDQIIGYNIFNISKTLKIHAGGFIPLIDKKVLEVINSILVNEGFEQLEYQNDSGFVVGEIIYMEEHPDSEHLHICKVNIGKEEPLQIVCGSYNAKIGIKVVCATLYTFMPSGKQILPSKLLNVPSFGMLCSGRELALPGYENIKGLYILDDTYNIGDDFFKI